MGYKYCNVVQKIYVAFHEPLRLEVVKSVCL